MPENMPSRTALVTAACFSGGPLSTLAATIVGAGFVWFLLGLGWIVGLVLLGGAAGFAGAVLRTAADPRFIRQVAAEDASLPLPGRPGQAALPGPRGDLTGRYLTEYRRVEQLKEGLVGEIRALPAGPGRDAFCEMVPKLDEVTREVYELVSRMAKVEKDLGSGLIATLQKEVEDLEKKVAATNDAETRQQLETALTKKREALGHYQKASQGVGRIGAQVEAIASGLQEARARVAALRSSPDQGIELSPARQAVEGISQEVKYLAEAVEETTKLLQ